MDAAVQRMLDERAVEKVHVRYCRGIDRMDWKLVRSCFHEDAYADYGDFKGKLDDFITYAQRGVIFQYTMHFIGNQLVEIDGDTAWAEHYTRAFHRILPTAEAPSSDWNMNLRYIDRMEKRQGEWRIAHRVMVFECLHMLPVGEVPAFVSDFNMGVRGPGDLCYSRKR
jgi:hypothetical protein